VKVTITGSFHCVSLYGIVQVIIVRMFVVGAEFTSTFLKIRTEPLKAIKVTQEHCRASFG